MLLNSSDPTRSSAACGLSSSNKGVSSPGEDSEKDDFRPPFPNENDFRHLFRPLFRPFSAPQNKRLRAVLTRKVDDKDVNAKDVVFDWLAKEVRQRDPQERRTVVAIMDGETKLRDLQEVQIDRAIGILDIWHVTEYFWKLAHCFHPEGSDKAESFVETYLRKLLEGKVRRAIGGIRQMVTKGGLSKHRQEKAEQYLNYFADRCEYMKYDEYLAAGYPIGSGVVEGACRHLVKDRMEQTGMRWRIAGAQAVLSLRAIYINEDWDTFHAARIQAEQRKLYPYKRRLEAILNCAT
jgi:hypothetical protein